MALTQLAISIPSLKHPRSSSEYRKCVGSLNDIGIYINILLNEASNIQLDKKEHSNSFFIPSYFNSI